MSDATQKRPTGGGVQEQVILPWPVAIRITLRGLKIRLGRSLITMSGVVLGIAFLMSVLTGEALRGGLADERRTKTEVGRLLKLVEEEIGTFENRQLAILVTGPVKDEHQRRLLGRMEEIAEDGALRILHCQTDALETASKALPAGIGGAAFSAATSVDGAFEGAHVAILLHEDLPDIPSAELKRLLGIMQQPVLLDYQFGRYAEEDLRELNPKALYTSLHYQKTKEQKLKEAKQAKQAQARQIWITIVSMLVTVIGIANAMLMSVTERFREIGTMKCLGALSGFVVKLFLIESFIIGALGAIVGTILGFLVPFSAYMASSGIGLLFASTPFLELLFAGVASMLAGTILAIIAAIYPARVAAKMVPADALRTNV
ncbi:MAG: FtsX-like permease family protein [Victivallales bacterium]|nr:FtsX-like permease family protein [Victivallales bacterium]